MLHTEASLGLGGQELRILAETRWLLDHGWRALIACQPTSRLLGEAQAAGLPVVAVRMRSALDLAALRTLRRVMRTETVGVVHTHSSVDAWVGGLAARSMRRPLVRSRHVSIPVAPRRAFVYRLADRILASGDAVKSVLTRAGVDAGKIVSVPAGVDTTRFHPDVSGAAVRAELGLTGQVVGLVANIRGSKGHNVFVQAAEEILRSLPDVRFLIVGDGVGYDEVRQRVRERGLEGRVILTGFRRDVPEIMAALDVLVLPSLRSEATSQVIPQALAIGVPVAATSVGGIPEIIRDGDNGRLVPPGDALALAEAITALLRDPAGARAMARRGRALVHEQLTFDAMMRQTTAVYAELLGGRPGSV